ncbi:TetR family transcriptional regulator [Terrabacter sp. MAHUQ-38]|uniref:TetR/AcrR family transcriptional regulator n=1 Tax=unclassified Terrabacter TaxID=2630222 RepID=UPI00165E72AD|nr:TetR family transcriptional regulator [Terrabacter sp. MAHUQ-38]MBC9819795.1 TetR/AcrR family transcriptional regulator [Terrabacter sp. MAHUQ-38]
MPPRHPSSPSAGRAGRTGRAGRSGPRTDRSDVRSDILAAARTLFAAQGFRGTTLRAVADAAGVDVALVPYYFGNKDGLFAATLELPVDPRATLDEVFAAGLDGIGERIVRTMAGLLEDEQTGPALIAIMRSAVAQDSGNEVVRDFVLNVILEGYARHLDVPDANRRAALAATQLVGLALGRHVLRIPPLVEMTVDDLVEQVGPTLQRYLAGD